MQVGGGIRWCRLGSTLGLKSWRALIGPFYRVLFKTRYSFTATDYNRVGEAWRRRRKSR